MAKKKEAKKAKQPEDPKQKLLDLCVDILAHVELDCEWTSNRGNGTNCAEAGNVADDILDILGVKEKDLKDQIESRADELKKDYGFPDDDGVDDDDEDEDDIEDED